MNTQDTGTSGGASVRSAGVAYKIGLGVIAAGIVIAASSLFLGGVTFSAVSALLTLLGAPEDREFLPTYEPEAGGQLLQFFGAIILVCGICIVAIRIVAELLGLRRQAGAYRQAGLGGQGGGGRGSQSGSSSALPVGSPSSSSTRYSSTSMGLARRCSHLR